MPGQMGGMGGGMMGQQQPPQGMGGALPWPALLRKLDQQMPGYDQ